MELTAKAKVTAVAGWAALAAGTTFLAYSLVQGHTAHALAGVCLTTTSLTLLALVTIRRWIVTTAQERKRLADAIREVEAEKAKYITSQAALEMERQRIVRDADAERAALSAQAIAERQALHDEFDEKRAELVCKTLEASAKLLRRLDAEPLEAHEHAAVTPLFPDQQPERARERGAR